MLFRSVQYKPTRSPDYWLRCLYTYVLLYTRGKRGVLQWTTVLLPNSRSEKTRTPSLSRELERESKSRGLFLPIFYFARSLRCYSSVLYTVRVCAGSKLFMHFPLFCSWFLFCFFQAISKSSGYCLYIIRAMRGIIRSNERKLQVFLANPIRRIIQRQI